MEASHPFNFVFKDEHIRRIIWEEKYMMLRLQHLRSETSELERRETMHIQEIKILRGELWYLKITISVMWLFLYYVAREASVKDRSWFGDNGIDLTTITTRVGGCLIWITFWCYWFAWSYDNAERYWYGH